MHGPLAAPVDGEGTVAHLPAVTVGAVEHPCPPEAGHAFEIRKSVVHAACEQEPAARDPASVPETELEPAVGEPARGAGFDTAALDRRVRRELLAPDASQVARRGSVTGEEPMHLLRHRMCRRIGIEDKDPPPHSSQDERRVQACRSRTNDEDIECLLGHAAPSNVRCMLTT